MSLYGTEAARAFIDLLAPQANALNNWKVVGPQKAVQRVYDKELKGYMYVSSGAGVKLQVPRDEKAVLGLMQPFLVLQVCLSQVPRVFIILVLSKHHA